MLESRGQENILRPSLGSQWFVKTMPFHVPCSLPSFAEDRLPGVL